ncbi:hypothetical protein ACCUM_3302 [Candidatus Accumulibacter phosphatis]|uniref:Mobile element protein n=3 Tax=Candidatus Accumulibacter phosphatis TaxID=327160 RepID=A0A5S4EPX2_9PROT|nr:hypothetical protein ACCUM_3302 [Candidatus Accumulibacter phosphatis]
MNLIERLWKFVKKQCLYAKYYPDFHSFTTAIERCLQDTHTIHAKALQSLLTLNFQTFQKIQSLPRTVYKRRLRGRTGHRQEQGRNKRPGEKPIESAP